MRARKSSVKAGVGKSASTDGGGGDAGAMIERAFFQRDPLTCARELIGCELVWGECAGIIVETEAYAAIGDEAAHTFFRPSARVFVASQAPGTAYVYFNYGMYWLFNVLVKGGTEDGFVLIRALEPIHGLDRMLARRFPGKSVPGPVKALCSGPGKLTIAMGIEGRDHGRDLCAAPGFGFRRRPAASAPATTGSAPTAGTAASAAEAPVGWVSDVRVGITKAADLPWRFLAVDSPFVSQKLGVPSRTAKTRCE